MIEHDLWTGIWIQKQTDLVPDLHIPDFFGDSNRKLNNEDTEWKFSRIIWTQTDWILSCATKFC